MKFKLNFIFSKNFNIVERSVQITEMLWWVRNKLEDEDPGRFGGENRKISWFPRKNPERRRSHDQYPRSGSSSISFISEENQSMCWHGKWIYSSVMWISCVFVVDMQERLLGAALGGIFAGIVVFEQRKCIYKSIADTRSQFDVQTLVFFKP